MRNPRDARLVMRLHAPRCRHDAVTAHSRRGQTLCTSRFPAHSETHPVLVYIQCVHNLALLEEHVPHDVVRVPAVRSES